MPLDFFLFIKTEVHLRQDIKYKYRKISNRRAPPIEEPPTFLDLNRFKPTSIKRSITPQI